MFHSRFVVLSILSNYLIVLLGLLVTAGSNGGFTVELIRRDSPKSPFYNANQTPKERLDALSQRQMRKVLPNTLQNEARAYGGNFVIKLSIGKPPVDIFVILDTGSDLLWTQCLPCDSCYKQIYPPFDPLMSSTYNDISCQSEECHQLPSWTCSPKNLCNYDCWYADQSFTKGVWAKDTVTMTSTSGEKVSLDIFFGCGHNNSKNIMDIDYSYKTGILGLGRGVMSFVSQLASTSGSKSFSYCFTPLGSDPNNSSRISFGNSIEVLDDVVSTPLISKDTQPSFYFVTLKGISVGDKYLPYDSSSTVFEGNMILDSGAPITSVPIDLHHRLLAEVKQQILLDPIMDEKYLMSLCYKSENINLDAPILTVHFEGADVVLTPLHTFIPPPFPDDKVFCFGVYASPADQQYGIYGNFAQSNFLIGYDMEKMMVSFKPTDCTKQ